MKTIDFTGYEMNPINFNQINFKIVKELIKLKLSDELKIIFKENEELILQKVGGCVDAYNK